MYSPYFCMLSCVNWAAFMVCVFLFGVGWVVVVGYYNLMGVGSSRKLVNV